MERLEKLRKLMAKSDLDYYIVPSRDPHNNEYVPEIWQRRSWISGFTGSAGLVVVGKNQAWLFTDSRYYIQAGAELDPDHIELVRQDGFGARVSNWFRDKKEQVRVGIDSRTISPGEYSSLSAALKSTGSSLVAEPVNFVDQVRKDSGDVASMPAGKVSLWPDAVAGMGVKGKLALVRDKMAETGNVDTLLVTGLDEIAWLFNVRGQDVAFNPLVISYGLITADKALWFVDGSRVADDVRKSLESNGVELFPYGEFESRVKALKGTVWFDGLAASLWVKNLLNDSVRQESSPSPIALLKACKNPTEIKGMAHAHEKDAVAVIRFLKWLEENWQSGVSEVSLVDRLLKFRQENPDFRGESFDTISGFASNGAIVHYRAGASTDKKVDDSDMFLLDSGGQYEEGTTDITRTVHLGTPTAGHKKHYTLVLQGHLALGNAVFSRGTAGENLDALARLPLWREGLNYGHGTGHGVGCYLCVHEGPQRISPAPGGVALQPGMVVSNEPGVYFEGKYGIRIENLCYVEEAVEAADPQSGHGPFYRFRDLTLVPYSRKLMDTSLLSDAELRQINSYHERVLRCIGPRLNEDDRAWLAEQCRPVVKC